MTTALQFLRWRLAHPRRDARRREIAAWLEAPGRGEDPELREVADFLRRNPPDVLPYDFAQAYYDAPVRIHRDPDTGLPFVIHDSHRLYWPEDWDARRITRDYNALRARQDRHSPHRYLSDGFDLDAGEVLVDVGAAEGALALEVIERAGHAYLFEPDPLWTRALAATFAPWREKVTIVPLRLCDRSGGGMARLDAYFGPGGPGDGRRIGLLKLDVQGDEARVLDGARGLMSAGRVRRAAVCACHHAGDEDRLSARLRDTGFTVEPTQRYMLFGQEDRLTPPYVRRGVLRATRQA